MVMEVTMSQVTCGQESALWSRDPWSYVKAVFAIVAAKGIPPGGLCQGDPSEGILPGVSCQGDPAKGLLPRGSCQGGGWCGLVGVDCECGLTDVNG